MIVNAAGSILDSECEAIVIPANCVGVHGAGLALAAAERWPEAARQYRQQSHWLKPGVVCHTVQPRNWKRPLNVIWFPTKRHWQNPSELEWISSGLEALLFLVRELYWPEIAVPALGCGLGGLSWADVRPLIERAFDGYAGTMHLYAPGIEKN